MFSSDGKQMRNFIAWNWCYSRIINAAKPFTCLINIKFLVSFYKYKTLYMINRNCRNNLKFGAQRFQVHKLLHETENRMPLTSNHAFDFPDNWVLGGRQIYISVSCSFTVQSIFLVSNKSRSSIVPLFHHLIKFNLIYLFLFGNKWEGMKFLCFFLYLVLCFSFFLCRIESTIITLALALALVDLSCIFEELKNLAILPLAASAGGLVFPKDAATLPLATGGGDLLALRRHFRVREILGFIFRGKNRRCEQARRRAGYIHAEDE
uniref:Uncharacterized protein MANES_07G094600 n=1 Tax=Rhizophora mucronata TaxID=61149 RepID=A0A2P2IZC8_RHIMU